MQEVKWIKITTDIFDDEKIKLIDTMPDRDTMLVIWFKLLALAGKINDNGFVYIMRNIPTTDEMIATIFNRPLNTVRLALQTFKNFGMIEITDHVNIINWEKHQNIEGLDKIRKQNAERQKRLRDNKAKQLEHNSNVTVTLRNGTDKIREDKIREDKIREDKKEIKEDQKNPSSDLIKDYVELVSNATGLNIFQVEQHIELYMLRNYDISLLILKIKESDFLLGRLDTKPTIRNFTQKKMMDSIILDFYKNKAAKVKRPKSDQYYKDMEKLGYIFDDIGNIIKSPDGDL